MIYLIVHIAIIWIGFVITAACWFAFPNASQLEERIPVFICGICGAAIFIAGSLRAIEILYRRIHDKYWENSL